MVTSIAVVGKLRRPSGDYCRMGLEQGWPADRGELIALQESLGRAAPAPWSPQAMPRVFGAVFVAFSKGRSGAGAAGEPAWASAVLATARRQLETAACTGVAGAGYESGLLALREGALMATAVRRLAASPEVLLIDATGRDHPRRAGLALHLGAVIDMPTIGVTHRVLCATGEWPPDEPGARAPLVVDGDVVGYWVRTRRGTRPLAIHAAWRTSPEVAVNVALAACHRARTPQPLRFARRLARLARAGKVDIPFCDQGG